MFATGLSSTGTRQSHSQLPQSWSRGCWFRGALLLIVVPIVLWFREDFLALSNVKYTNTRIHKYKNTKWLKDPTCATFFKSMVPPIQLVFNSTGLPFKWSHNSGRFDEAYCLDAIFSSDRSSNVYLGHHIPSTFFRFRAILHINIG